jgi:hypothetical protein
MESIFLSVKFSLLRDVFSESSVEPYKYLRVFQLSTTIVHILNWNDSLVIPWLFSVLYNDLERLLFKQGGREGGTFSY